MQDNWTGKSKEKATQMYDWWKFVKYIFSTELCLLDIIKLKIISMS